MDVWTTRIVREAHYDIVTAVNTYNSGLASCDPYQEWRFYMVFVICFLLIFFLIRAYAIGSLSPRPVYMNLFICSVIIALFITVSVKYIYGPVEDTAYHIYYRPGAAARYACLYGHKQISLEPLLVNSTRFLLGIYRYAYPENWGWPQYYLAMEAIRTLQTHTLEQYYLNNCTYSCTS